MTTKRPSLFGSHKPAVVAESPRLAASATQPNVPHEMAANLAVEFSASGEKEPARRYPVASTRQGKRVTGVYLSDEALAQLKIIAARERKTIQTLMQEAVNGLFEARGLSRIA